MPPGSKAKTIRSMFSLFVRCHWRPHVLVRWDKVTDELLYFLFPTRPHLSRLSGKPAYVRLRYTSMSLEGGASHAPPTITEHLA